MFEPGDRVDVYGKPARVISVGKRYVTVQIDGDEDGPSNWHASYLKKLLPCGHRQSDLTEGGQYGPFCAVCAVEDATAGRTERTTPCNADIGIAEALRRVRNAVGNVLVRADGNLNQRDFYDALNVEFRQAQVEAYGEDTDDA